CCSCLLIRLCPMSTRRQQCTCTPTPCSSGADDGRRERFSWKMQPDGGAKPSLPPLDQALVKAAACGLVHYEMEH
ncbi:MAG: hypothetical protein ACREOH_17795, partial [Candidatus Entotheonellia bacterium]